MPHQFSPVAFDSGFAHIINGEKHISSTSLDIINPATRQPFATVPRATQADVDAAVASARAAFPGWAATPWAQRAAAVAKLGDLCEQFVPELTALLTRESGKPVKTHSGWEVYASMAWFRGIAAQTLPEEHTETPETVFIQRFNPLGVGAAIVPWNYPLILMAFKVSSALVTGNTMVVKPSPTTPLATLKFVELAQQVLPPGVLSVICGGDELGPMLTSHSGIDKIAFTGSTPTGQAVLRSAAAGMKRVTLELGGNDAAIILPDVDVKKLAPELFWVMFSNSGQLCIAAKRVYIHANIYDALLDELVRFTESVKIGNGLDESVGLGPLQNEAQYNRVQELLEHCKKSGLKMHTAGQVDDKLLGYFMPVTIVDNPPEDSRVVLEEPFGPICPLLKWTDEDDVVQRANASPFGLGASVWSADVERATRIAGRLAAGTVWVNQWLKLHPFMAFGGHKLSGMGVEGGRGDLVGWTNSTVVAVCKTHDAFASGPSQTA